MNVAVIEFPGSGGAPDVARAYAENLDQTVSTVWHQEESLGKADIVVVPGGAAFGDYLRPGALTRGSPIIGALRKFARDGGFVLGVGNGFQILCEIDILPGVLLPNVPARFLNTSAFVSVENQKSPWTRHLEEETLLSLPLSCYAGRYFADKRTLRDIEEEGRVAFRFCDRDGDSDMDKPFNGSAHSIAGIVNRHENVLGLMCHPERAIESYMGSCDGLAVLRSVLLGEQTSDEVAIVDDDDDDDDDDE